MFEVFETGWMEERLRELGRPKKGLAQVIGQSEARATGILKGTRQIKARELAAISHYLELPVEEILRRSCGDPGYREAPQAAGSTASVKSARSGPGSGRPDEESAFHRDPVGRSAAHRR